MISFAGHVFTEFQMGIVFGAALVLGVWTVLFAAVVSLLKVKVQ